MVYWHMYSVMVILNVRLNEMVNFVRYVHISRGLTVIVLKSWWLYMWVAPIPNGCEVFCYLSIFLQVYSLACLMSSDGHVIIKHGFIQIPYTDARGKQQYLIHLKHLIFLLRNASNKLNHKQLCTLFLVNHPSLLNYTEKYKVYILVELLLHKHP